MKGLLILYFLTRHCDFKTLVARAGWGWKFKKNETCQCVSIYTGHDKIIGARCIVEKLPLVIHPNYQCVSGWGKGPSPLRPKRVSPVRVPSYDGALMRARASRASHSVVPWSVVKSRESPVKSRASSVKLCAMLVHTRAGRLMEVRCKSSGEVPCYNGHTREKGRVSTGKCTAPSWWVFVFEGKYIWSSFFFLSWWLALMSGLLIWWSNDGGQWREDGSRGEELYIESNCRYLSASLKKHLWPDSCYYTYTVCNTGCVLYYANTRMTITL